MPIDVRISLAITLYYYYRQGSEKVVCLLVGLEKTVFYIILFDFIYKLLYINTMKNMSAIFTSKARVKILRTLCFQEQAIPLRHLAYLSDLPVFSVQNALKAFVSEGLIVRTERDNNVLFELNPSDVFYPLMRQIFHLETGYHIRSEAKKYFAKAAQVLQFAGITHRILSRARKEA